MSIAKIPCILVTAIALNKSFTPPSYPSKGEAIPIVNTLDRFMRVISGSTPTGFIRGMFWVPGIAEIAVIMANRWPSLPLSKCILSMSMLHGIPKDLRLTPLSVTGMSLIILGTIMRVYCYRKLKNLFTFDISIRANHKLITTGLYGIVRHPSYSALILVYVGAGLWYGSRGSWLRESGVLYSTTGRTFTWMFATMMLMVLAGIVERIPRENAALKKAFGREWSEWAHRVPYSIIPGVY